ncbi:MAG: hypothetical protein IAE89_11765 [Anaerolineae bacterium]|nr:hypothetical protein [Anaerolineae bacterium]
MASNLPLALKQLLIRLSPYGVVRPEQPLLQLESRRIPWGRSLNHFVNRTVFWLLATSITIVAAWIAIAILPLFIAPDTAYRGALLLNQRTSVFVSVGVLVFIFLSLVLDVTSIRSALGSINSDLRNGRMDMLRLTNMREGQFILAKYGVAQLHAWRMTAILVGARLGLMLVLVVWFWLYILFDMRIDTTSMIYTLPSRSAIEGILASDPLVFVIGFSITLSAVLAFIATFVLEPIWRMRGLTAVSMAVSARVSDHSMAVISGGAVLLALWFSQIAILLGVTIFAFIISPFGIFVLPFVYFACIFLAYMAFFALVKTVSLRVVARKMAALAN